MRYLSLFSGMECAWQAWHPLGWECAAVAEIDPRACEVLAHRLNASAPKYLPAKFDPKAYAHLPPFGTPGTLPNFGDVSQVTDEDIAALGRLDVLIGGSPCQDLSVAGKRAGLAGERSGLFHEQLRIFHAARHFCGARWLVWENVPGAFSSNRGRDFAVVVGAMAGLELPVPEDGWGSEGLALGPAGLVEWSVLDAQWFGVAQRRRRVFAVLDTGNWTDRSPVLLERDSLRGDSAPRREAREGAAGRVAASVALRGREGGGAAEVGDDCAFTLRASSGGGGKPHALIGGGLPNVSMCLNAGAMGRQDAESETLIPTFGGGFDVAHTLRADGFDASEDGTGRGTPLGPVAFDTTQITSKANYSNPQPGDPCHPLAAGMHPPAIAFAADDYKTGSFEVCDVARGLTTSADRTRAAPIATVAFAQNQRDEVRQMDVAGALAAEPGMKQQTYLAQAMAVRRLTPRECERLQGVEDDWTLVPSGKKGKPMADGPRYKMLGNSFARPVITWIGQQIERATKQSAMERAA